MIETSGYAVVKKSEKKSGGNVNVDWVIQTLGELTILNYGKGLTFENRKSGNIPVYSSAGITGYHNQALVNEAGIIVGRKGTVGTVYYSDVPFYCIDTAYYIKKSDINFDLKFLYYLMKNLKLNLLNEDSAVPGLNRDTAYSQICLVPKSNNLKIKIANILSSFDDKIELNHKMNQTLEETAKAIFKEWFIDFGPVKAKAEGRKPIGMDKETASLFPDSFEESELGLIPKGWKVGSLGNIINAKGGYAFKSIDFSETGYSIIKIKNINGNGDINLKDVDFVPHKIVKNLINFKLTENDILMAMTGATVGKFGIFVQYINSMAYLNQRVAKIEPNNEKFRWFIYSALFDYKLLLSNSKQSGRKRSAKYKFYRYRVKLLNFTSR